MKILFKSLVSIFLISMCVCVSAQDERPALPWPMSAEMKFNGMSVEEYMLNLCDQSKESVEQLREQLYARYLDDVKREKAGASAYLQAREEKERFWFFFSKAQNLVDIALSGVSITPDGAIISKNVQRLITSRKGGGIGYFAVGDKPGEYKFTSLGGDGAYLDPESLATAKEAAARMRRIQDLFKGLHLMLEEAGEECSYRNRYLYNFAGIYAMGVEGAIEKNIPENIERRPMPKAGTLNASLKAQALKIAKASNPNVSDVVIVSDSWDVKRDALGQITHRSVYGYYIINDDNGKLCERRAWTQSYQGGGKYGSLRAGGVGVESPFYAK